MPRSMVRLSAGREEMSDETAGAVLPRRRQFDLLRPAPADHAQSRRATTIERCSDRLGLAPSRRPMRDADEPDWLAAGLASSLAALCADEDRAGAAAGGAHRGLPHHPRRRPRADRRHRVVVDGVPRLQPSAYPPRRSRASSSTCRMSCSAGLAHEPAARLAHAARRAAAGRSRPRVLFRIRARSRSRSRSRWRVQYWRNRGVAGRSRFVAFRGGYHGDTAARWRSAIPTTACTAACRGLLPRIRSSADLPRDEASARAARRVISRATRNEHRRASSSSRWCRARAA